MIICNFKQVNLGATIIKEQNVKNLVNCQIKGTTSKSQEMNDTKKQISVEK